MQQQVGQVAWRAGFDAIHPWDAQVVFMKDTPCYLMMCITGAGKRAGNPDFGLFSHEGPFRCCGCAGLGKD